MKIANSDFKLDEFIFCSFLVLIFSGMIIGGLKFEATAMFFPITLSILGMIFILSYFLRGFLPNKINNLISGEHKSKNDNDVNIFKTYSLFIFTGAFIFSCYLLGFYLSTFLSLILFLHKTRTFKKNSLIGNLVLLIIIIGTVYIFDTAFGYHFEEGSLLSFP